MLGKIIGFIKNNIDFKFYGVSWIAFFVGLSIIPMVLYLPQKYGYENGLIENIQMFVLFIILYLCLTSKVNKRFFNFCALALSLIIIREVNCGRTLFFPIPHDSPLYTEARAYYSWKELPYSWLGKVVHGIYGAWIATVAFIFFKKKIHLDTWKIIKNIKFPFWNIAFAAIATFMGAIAEKLTNNNYVFEEGFELLFYVSILGMVWLYSRNKNFILKEELEIETSASAEKSCNS